MINMIIYHNKVGSIPGMKQWVIIQKSIQVIHYILYMDQELPDVQTGFRKGRGTRDQTDSTHCIIEKAREF